VSPGFRLERGAVALAGGGVRFAVWAPHTARVEVRLGRAPGRTHALVAAEGGVFEGELADARAGDDYVLVLDGRERADPVSRHQPRGVHGPSRVVDPEAFVWGDADWRGLERGELVFYELHVGTFTPAGTFEAVRERLADLHGLGVTALELMPVGEFPGTRNWGYDGVFPYAPQSSYGGPDGLRALVDAAHAAGLAVILDVVYNHLGPEGNVLADFGPYFTDRYRTPWGQAVNFDGPGSDEVRRYFRDNALHWIAEYHLDGLRLDAVHAIHDESARPFLAELAAGVHGLGAELGRRVHVIAESDANDPRLVRGADRGGLGLDAVWNDDFHHAVHAALTGERTGYYVDFGGLGPVARAWRDRFVHAGAWSGYRQRRHGAPAHDVPHDRFVVFVQNHDQVGNRARGERLATLLSPARQRLAAALLLLAPGLPLLFMGEEYGETAPFLYFVDHADAALLAAVRRGRRAEFEALAGSDVPDPADPSTFERSRLRPERAREEGPAGLRRLYRELLALRREQPALAAGTEAELEGDPDAGWFLALRRPPAGATALAAFHLGPARREVPPPAPGRWQLRLATDDAAFGGPGCGARSRLEAGDSLVLPGETALLYLDGAA
jgi:maltooligosyltrehalose trehalohydrolase